MASTAPVSYLLIAGKASAAEQEAPDVLEGEEDDEHEQSDEEDDSEESGSSSSSGSEDDSGPAEGSDGEEPEDEDPNDTTVDVTLEFFDPKEADFLGLKALLQSYLDGATFACSELVDLIIKQPTVGTVVKSGDDEDPIGVLTALSTRRYASSEALADIRQHLLRHCADAGTKAQLTTAWEGRRTALLVSERLINCPPQLAPPLQQALFDEIQWATEDEPTEELRDSFRLDTFIAFTRVFRDPTPQAAPAAGSGKKRQKPQAAPALVFARPEDEFYHKHCSASFTFATERAVAADELQPLRLVMLLSKQQVAAARRELDAVVGNAAAADEGPSS